MDLRLDALEGMLNLPITFVSGHIHELRLHVPWTKLGSEPVVITFNTIECVVKVGLCCKPYLCRVVTKDLNLCVPELPSIMI